MTPVGVFRKRRNKCSHRSVWPAPKRAGEKSKSLSGLGQLAAIGGGLPKTVRTASQSIVMQMWPEDPVVMMRLPANGIPNGATKNKIITKPSQSAFYDAVHSGKKWECLGNE